MVRINRIERANSYLKRKVFILRQLDDKNFEVFFVIIVLQKVVHPTGEEVQHC